MKKQTAPLIIILIFLALIFGYLYFSIIFYIANILFY